MTDPIVSTTWLSEHIDDSTIIVLDASWHMPASGRDAAAEFTASHIPGAVFFDIDQISDHSSPLPHMLPSPSEFATSARRLGVSSASTVVVYDSVGLFSAPRVWWEFRAMGHEAIFVLDGGLPRWIAEGRPLETGWRTPAHGEFKAQPREGWVRDLQAVTTALDQGEQVLDARPTTRFSGEAPEPRPGLRSGHMPGAKSLPFTALVDHGSLASATRLEKIMDEHNIDLMRPTISTCGSGVSAAVIVLAFARLGHRAAIYDGSWSEWGSRGDTAVVTGV